VAARRRDPAIDPKVERNCLIVGIFTEGFSLFFQVNSL